MVRPMTTNILDYTYTELESWFSEYREAMASWGGFLLEPYPDLLTTWYAERVIAYKNMEDKSNVTPYDCVIPADEYVILAAERHMKDLEKQGTDDFPWIFDTEKAHRPIRFIEKKCKPSKGSFERLVMQPWQHFVIGSIFGWIHRETGIRRFREAVDFIGRKNGKTTKVSGLSNYMLSEDGENGANIYILANSQKQSNILFKEAKAMVEKSPFLMKKLKPMAREILYPQKNCSMVALSAEKDKDGENLHFGCFDEVHDYEDYYLINVMKRSRAMRSQPLIMYITTAGTKIDGPLMDMVDAGKECLERYEENLDERTFYFLAMLDDISEADNPECWIKANPNFCLMDVVSMVTDYKKDRKVSSEKADWVTKQFNLFSDISDMSFVDNHIILKNNKTIDIKELRGKKCVGGYDLSDSEDFTSAILEFPLETGEIFILNHSWIPRARYERDKNPQRLRKWEKEGELTIIDGDYVDFQYVLDWFKEMNQLYDIVLIRYDPAKAIRLNKELEQFGFETEIARQGFFTLGGPLQNFKEMLLDTKVIFNNSGMFRWFLSNVALRKDRNDNWLPTKSSKSRKIDGFAATLNAHCTVIDMLIKPSKGSNIGVLTMKDLLRK